MLEGRHELFYNVITGETLITWCSDLPEDRHSEAMSRANLWSLAGEIPFLTTCDAMELAEM